MIVPAYWAEGRARCRDARRQVTVRRFGWSDASQDEAQANADRRAAEALEQILSGHKLIRREPRIAYNGADGVPIREEIVSRHGDAVVTRNAYGARCLNVASVFFADIDFETASTDARVVARFVLFALAGALLGWIKGMLGLGIVLGCIAFAASGGLVRTTGRMIRKLRGGEESVARARLVRFVAANPDWSVRLYRTPAGLRVMATHALLQPNDRLVARCFAAIEVDPVYARMCRHQNCFRARLTAKPWRIGIDQHMKPRPGTWPVEPLRLAERSAWVARYEDTARAFAACRFVETIGSGVVHPEIAPILAVHDDLSGALGGRPIA